MFQIMINPTLMYGAETWILIKKKKKKQNLSYRNENNKDHTR